MEKVVLFDPSIRSLNIGDHIIMESAERELRDIIDNKFIIKCATHAPAVTFYQNTIHNPRIKMYDDIKLKFICGSNLLWKNLFRPRPTFNINLWNSRIYANSILLGVGTDKSEKKVNAYTKKLYRDILSRNIVHSVRDEKTKKLVESLGFRAINTGCPTMWRFTEEFCGQIPKAKSEKVVFTLTDYSENRECDQKLIDILLKNYSEVYFWIQGVYDLEYLKSLNRIEKVKIVAPTIDAYQNLLLNNDIEYVGTRLHGGMFAMQHKKRTIVLTVDNRVRDIKETYKINSLERERVEELDLLINSNIETKMTVDLSKINQWLSQFKEN